jgi:hypothetical protein
MLLPWQLYLGAGAALAGSAWFLNNTRDPRATDNSNEKAAPRPKSRRDELIEARDRVRRQLEILKSPQRGDDYTNFSAETANQMQKILEEIETELKERPRV